MSEIKRYKVGSYRMAEHGDMVFYDDHLAAINQAKIDAVREFANQYEDLLGRLPEYAEKFIEQLKQQG